ncbi:uncharacterized protein LOC110416122 [Herrania umbratica]|uniref:Uncharacterized protein LOC110416122 n=1 Tax=Herrania umbratica TaxID=108875 RepID=A0A6J1A9X6_9ROSI|nr:uncharacterized protein LOC110416122 [Herrania umbratica]XP_021283646.1 uncharacterized protein LOC110416122 [Herrania umbratica]
MGALAPVVSSWIPEDDLLLKNAIEAGASLESLAKGAVQFSRKFTVRELQERWHSLLYDPVVSEEASSRMIEFERSASTLSLRFGRTGNPKDNRSLSGKRKSESVRSCYYALRKRIRNEPFNSMDLSFLIVPNDGNYVGIEDESLPGNCMLGNPISDHFGIQETNKNIMHCSFPQILGDGGAGTRDGCTTDGFQTSFLKQDDDGFPAEPVKIHKEIPHILGENQFLVESGSGIEELHQPKELPVHSLFESNDLMVKPSSTFDQINNDPENICSELEGNQVFNSPIVECGLSIWRAHDGLSASAIPTGDGCGEKDLHAGDIYALPGDDVAESNRVSGHDVVDTGSQLESAIPCEELENQTANTEGYLVEITNTLMNDEPFFMDVDAKDVIDKSYFDGLSSLLASSPNNVDQDQMADLTELMTSETPDNLGKVSCSRLGELDEVAGSCSVDGPVSRNSEVLMLSSASTSDSQFPELTNGIICCTLNTEDAEIPCNEDVVFAKQLCPLVVSATRRNFKEASNPLSACVNDFSGGQKTSEGGSLLGQRDQKDPGQSHGSPQMKASKMIAEMGQLHPISDCRVKCKDSPCVAPRSDGLLANNSAQINSINVSEGTLPPTLTKEKSEEFLLGKHRIHSSVDSLIEKPALCSDGHNSYPLVNSSAIKQEMDPPEMIRDHQASSTEVGSMDIISPEPVIDPPPPDLEELLIESDDDVPYFSDTEAMILDMDLDPDDQDLCDQEVARYQREVTKRAIIRLEQGSHSYMQRAIASRGAFAILYGRHSKHYIKKPEILLGRTTEDFVVDIDLGREGCANKVSRRQAIINLEEDGSFHLKNLGRCSVSINSKEVAPGQSLILNSSCLIEIRGMPFIFETNQTCVKQYLTSATKKC